PNYQLKNHFHSLEVNSLVKSFKKKSRFSEFRLRKDAYEAVVRRLAAGEHFSAIESVLEYQKKFKNNMADERFGVRLIILYGKAGMFDHAYKVFDELPQLGCTRTVLSFNALLSACVKSKNLDKVNGIFHKLPGELGVEPDGFSYSTVIKAFCELKDFDSAMKVLEETEGRGIGPNIVGYNTILGAYYRENNLVEAEKLWRRMEDKGVIADVWSYNAKIRNLIRNDRVEEALDLVEKMVIIQVKPDKFTYNAVIKGCVGKSKLEEVKMFHGKMVGDDCDPDYVTFEMLISFACDQGDIDFAFEVCKQAIELKVFVYKSLMQLVVDALLERSRIEEANELVALINSSKRHPYTLTLPITR
ncbi:hypothetical protein Leryth_026166, partial [Lithospermum erythrorhizon]